MHFLISLIIVLGFVFVVCLSLVNVIYDLSQVSVHEPPAILETPGKPVGAEQPHAKPVGSYEARPTELSNT
jgi:hypothetical protein